LKTTDKHTIWLNKIRINNNIYIKVIVPCLFQYIKYNKKIKKFFGTVRFLCSDFPFQHSFLYLEARLWLIQLSFCHNNIRHIYYILHKRKMWNSSTAKQDILKESVHYVLFLLSVLLDTMKETVHHTLSSLMQPGWKQTSNGKEP
jgi:hypothetical protein